jgi:antibiotic biosynthesis monooxygenase (ABM) superfamily enzyme
MELKSVIWTVGIQCRPEDEDKFNRWYDEVHVPMLLQGGCVAKVTRYRLASKTYDVAPTAMKCPEYQTVYEFESEEKFEAWMNGKERSAAGKDKSETWSEKPYDVIWASRYDVMGIWKA